MALSDANLRLVPPETRELVTRELRASNSTLERRFVDEEENIKKSLEQLSSRTGMPIVVENGQRRFGPRLETAGCPPPFGSEVFVGKLPRNCLETELIPILESIGPIYQIRMMVTLGGLNRGFCFVTFFNRHDAERAIRELDNFEIRKGWYIGVSHSLNKRNVFVRNLPKDKEEEEIKFLISSLATGVVNITVPKSTFIDQRIKNRGYCFIEFDSHKSAVTFLVGWYNGHICIFNNDVVVEWADLLPDPYSISVTNVSPSTTEESLCEIFNRVCDNGVTRVDKKHNRAIIYFQSQRQADLAKYSLYGKLIDGSKIRIKLNKLNQNSRASHDRENGFLSSEFGNMDAQVPANNNYYTSDVCQYQHSNGGLQAAGGYNTATINPVVNLPYLGCNNLQRASILPPPGVIHQSQNAFMPLPLMATPQPVFSGSYGYVPYIPSPVYVVPIPVFPEPQQPL